MKEGWGRAGVGEWGKLGEKVGRKEDVKQVGRVACEKRDGEGYGNEDAGASSTRRTPGKRKADTGLSDEALVMALSIAVGATSRPDLGEICPPRLLGSERSERGPARSQRCRAARMKRH